MISRNKGATSICNLIDDSMDTSADISNMRKIQTQLDHEVAISYGWRDIDLEHGFHKTPQGVQFTISKSARIEILQRLLRLNHDRYKNEVSEGLHRKSTSENQKSRTRASKETAPQQRLNFGEVANDFLESPSYDTSVLILEYLSASADWRTKSDVVDATGIADGQWNVAIAALIFAGTVERQGERRGARYRAADIGGAAQ